jgi:hypothetical protein
MARIGELDIGQDLQFEKRWWKIERTGWTIILLVLIAALLGFLGPAPLTKKIAGQRNGPLWLEYYPFERYQAPVELGVQVRPGAVNEKVIRLWLDRHYVEAIEIEHIDPEPESVEIAGDRFVYTFKASDLRQNAKIMFHLEPNKFGKARVRLGLVDGPEIAFTQFIYP